MAAAVYCPAEHKPWQISKRSGLRMSKAFGQPMPYGYTLWVYVHFIVRGGGSSTCGHNERRLEK
jgi:hypothetical protein